VRGGLTGWQLRRATDYIEAGLPGPIRIQELAMLVGLSTSQFGRAFRQSTGQSPHRWHLNARIRRAQALMLETAAPLAEIALTVGFADQSHFANTFARLHGGSPGTWRREQRLEQVGALATHPTGSGTTVSLPAEPALV
jgi:transcriptional regulator GlxA family with amidase domain